MTAFDCSLEPDSAHVGTQPRLGYPNDNVEALLEYLTSNLLSTK